MKANWKKIVGWTAVAALVIGVAILIWLAAIGIVEMSNLCARGGYAYSTNLAGVDLCIGVTDGEWQIEPLSDVRERLGE